MSIFGWYIPRGLWLTVLAALLFGVIAYQFRPSYTIPVGSWYDRTALRDGWWDDEIADGVRYRWTKAQAEIEIADLGTLTYGGYYLEIDVQPAPQNPEPQITINIAGQELAPDYNDNVNGSYAFRFGHQLLDEVGSSPHILINVHTFTVAGDSRNLGVKVTKILLDGTAKGDFNIYIPPFAPLIYLTLVCVCFFLTRLRRHAFGALVNFFVLTVAIFAIARTSALSVWLLPAAALFALFVTLIVWRDKLFGWYPRWLEWVRGWPSQRDDGQRIRFNGETETTDAASSPAESSQRGFGGEGRPASTMGEGQDGQRISFNEGADTTQNSKLILIIAVIIYAAFTLWLNAQVDFIGHADYADNAVVARNIVRGNGAATDYVVQFYTPYANVRHAADTWPLLQPLLTVPFVAISDTTFAAKLPNVILAIVLVLSVYYLGRRIWDARVGLLGALLVLVYPYLLNMVVYPVNDLVFSLLFLWLLYIVVAHRLSDVGWWVWAGWGALAGLFIWAKPSGAIILLALFGYALWRGWRQRQVAGAMRRAAMNVAIVVAIGLAVISPLLVRNLSTFAAPFYSTESYDAWLLKWYPPVERIYALYPQSDLPNRSWLLRYGFDAMYRGMGREVQALWAGNSPTGGGSGLFGNISDILGQPNYGTSRLINKNDFWASDIFKPFTSGDIGSTLAVLLAILALFVAPRGWAGQRDDGQRIRFNGATVAAAAANGLESGQADELAVSSPTSSPQRGFGGEDRPATRQIEASNAALSTQHSALSTSVAPPLLLSLALHVMFLVTYWHYEPRYFQPYAVWVIMLAAAGICWLYDVLRRRALLAGIITGLLMAALFIPALAQIWHDTPIYVGATPLVDAAQWFKANTPLDTVAMSRNPWEFSWHSDRAGVMIPLDPQNLSRSLPQIKQVAQQYHATYLMLDHLGGPEATYFRSDWRRDIAPMYNPRTACKGFTLVYQNKSVVIYKLGVGAIGNTCKLVKCCVLVNAIDCVGTGGGPPNGASIDVGQQGRDKSAPLRNYHILHSTFYILHSALARQACWQRVK